MANVINYSLLTDFDINLFKGGKHYQIYKKLGNQPLELDGVWGTYFAVWAPNATEVSVIGNFNDWKKGEYQLYPRLDQSGIWEGWIPNVGKGALYKYAIKAHSGKWLEKGDPYAKYWEIPPNTASIVWDTYYEWNDKKWLNDRKKKAENPQPYSVYEVHLGSWKKKNGGFDSLSYRELAEELTAYVAEMGFTHVELMPVMEHPYYPSWGYQITGYFAPTSRFGQPEDFMYLVDKLHQAGIGVILDWVPSHFPEDAHGLAYFDGTHLYEHADPRKGFHPDWKSMIFNYDRHEVRSFLISNALYWLEEYHIDGLRVDAVASMLYLDYSRDEGQWIRNIYGGNENLEAISFLKEFNLAVKNDFPDVVTIAEESTAFAGVSKPVEHGGLGFDQKWMMGWMHDTLKYFLEEPMHRQFHHNQITFSLVYAFSENFQLPLSHDEVVHGKGPLIDKMRGDLREKFANLRLMFTYMYTHPGAKLLFMGGEFGQNKEWNFEKSLDWDLLQYPAHEGVRLLVKDLNELYNNSTALYEQQFSPEGFAWIDHADYKKSILIYIRKGKKAKDVLLVVCNFENILREKFRVGVPIAGTWKEVLNSDAKKYAGADNVNPRQQKSIKKEWHEQENSIEIMLPPLGISVFKLK